MCFGAHGFDSMSMDNSVFEKSYPFKHFTSRVLSLCVTIIYLDFYHLKRKSWDRLLFPSCFPLPSNLISEVVLTYQ